MNDDFWNMDFRRWNFKGRFHGVEVSSKTKWEGSLQDMASEKKSCSFILELNAHILLIFPFQRGNSQILRIKSSNCLQLYIYIYRDIQWYGSDPPNISNFRLPCSQLIKSETISWSHLLQLRPHLSKDRSPPQDPRQTQLAIAAEMAYRWWPLVVLLRCPHMVGWLVEEQRHYQFFALYIRRLGMMKISWDLRIMKFRVAERWIVAGLYAVFLSWGHQFTSYESIVAFSCEKKQNMWVWEPDLYNSGHGRGYMLPLVT